jgi:chromosomal replication initiator protein
MPSTADERLRFENFVVGAGNRAAVLAVTAVAEHPGRADSPLVISGGVGTGKTHLLRALRHFVAGRFPGRPHLVLETASLASIAADPASRAGVLQQAQRAFLITLDDIQTLEGDTAATQLLARVLDAAELSQVVVTSDRPVAQIVGLGPSLQSRLALGVHVEIDPPDLATRASLVRAAAVDYGATLTDAAVEEIARFAITDARQLFGYVRRLVATQRFQVHVEPEHRPTPAERASDGFEDLLVFADPEKICWDWPDLSARLVEDVH